MLKLLKQTWKKDFQKKEIIHAYSALGMRPISMVDAENLNDWGNEKIDVWINHFGQERIHEWTDEEVKKVKVREAYINPDETREEWKFCKRVVLAEVFPRDVMCELWSLIHTFHKDKFPNLSWLH